MRILLINANPVVSRLFTLCMRESGAFMDEISSLDTVPQESYDAVFIDDAAYATLSYSAVKRLWTSQFFLLSSLAIEQPELIDAVIKKPFLPSVILEALKQIPANVSPQKKRNEVEELLSFFSLNDMEVEALTQNENNEKDDEIEAENESVEKHENILNLQEIEKIKSLLDMEEEHIDTPTWKNEEDFELLKREVIKQNLIQEGLEIIEEEDVIHAIEAPLSLKITHNADHTEETKEHFETKLLEALKEMKIKKIKKLLKGAEITINIRFKDEYNA